MKNSLMTMKYFYGIKKVACTLLFSSAGAVFCQAAFADAQWTTPDDEALLVRWSQEELKPAPQTTEQSLREIQQHFQMAVLPGESWRYDRIHLLMQALERRSELPETDQVRYFQARLLQHRHQFTDAASELATISPDSEYYVSARLLLAQVHAELGQYEIAREACISLVLIQADLAAGCTAASTTKPDEKVQSMLTSLLERYDGNSSAVARDLRHWFLYQKARGLLANKEFLRVQQAYKRWADYDDLPVADLVILTESMLLSSQPSPVIELLGAYGAMRYPDDALIVQLARAEEQSDGRSQFWRDYAERRIEQRIRRQDASYSEIISLYYSTLVKDDKTFVEWKESISKTENSLNKSVVDQSVNPEYTDDELLISSYSSSVNGEK